jgi:hypothetical protein
MLNEMHLSLSSVEALCALARRAPVNELRSFTSVIASRVAAAFTELALAI